MVLSTCSLGTEDQYPGTSNRVVGVYKGLTVAVFHSTKEQIILTRQNLIDLVNVRYLYDILCFVLCYMTTDVVLRKKYFHANHL